MFLNCRKKVVRAVKKLNPLNNTRAMLKLNPYAAVTKRAAILGEQKRKEARELAIAKKRGITLPASSGAMKSLRTRERRIKALKAVKALRPKVDKKKSTKTTTAPAKTAEPVKKAAAAKPATKTTTKVAKK